MDRERIAAVCARIEAEPEATHTLAALAAQAGVSPSYLQRRFRALVGVSPRRYAEACRLGLLRRTLREGESVTDAIFAAGYGSTSRVYERVPQALGMSPARYRAGGAGLEIHYAEATTSLGPLVIAATGTGLCRVSFRDDDEAVAECLRAEFPGARLRPMPASGRVAFDAWIAALRASVEGEPPAAGLPLAVRGTAFQLRVWDYLCAIPCGETRSYGQIAAALRRPGSARAVAGACAANPVALAIPCHRVLRGDGALGGYRWGLERKRVLLDRERRAAASGG